VSNPGNRAAADLADCGNRADKGKDANRNEAILYPTTGFHK
jgi:hypothetical protein